MCAIQEKGHMTYKTFTLGDLRTLLAPLPTTRKQAVLYTLDTRGTLDYTTVLGWKEALRTPASEFAKDIIRAQPRHLRLDYVFWEYHETGQAAPLFGLEDSLREVTMGRSFPELQELYDRMVWIDSRVEAEHFVHTLLKELN
jgi:hypothetical protein